MEGGFASPIPPHLGKTSLVPLDRVRIRTGVLYLIYVLYFSSLFSIFSTVCAK